MASTTVALALVAHVLGGGVPPSTVVLGPLAAVALAAAVPFSGRRIGPLGAIALLGTGQVVLHVAFDLLRTMGCAPTSPLVTHAHAAQTVDLACTTSGSHLGASALLGASTMLVLHALATLATALLIAGTDRALSWIAHWLRPLVALLAPAVLPASACLPTQVETRRVARRRTVVVAPLRGPPVAATHVALAA